MIGTEAYRVKAAAGLADCHRMAGLLLCCADLQQGEEVRSYYTGVRYRYLVELGSVSLMQNLDTGQVETWNSTNNRHFTKTTQLSLF